MELYPSRSGVVVVPSDVTTLPYLTQRLFVGGAGNLVVTMADGNDVTFTGLLAGAILEIAVTKVKATGTTATNMVALF
jgi:hypothetical protein